MVDETAEEKMARLRKANAKAQKLFRDGMKNEDRVYVSAYIPKDKVKTFRAFVKKLIEE